MAARIYDFSPFFADKLRILREQIAFSRALVAGCGSGTMSGVLRDYPNGELHGTAEREVAICESQRRDAARREQAARDEVREQAMREQVIREQAQRDAIARQEAEYRAMQAERLARARDSEERERAATAPPARSNGLVARGEIEPSFACTPNLREPVAQLICADADLAAADAYLGKAYAAALAASPSPDVRRSIARAERAWVVQRNVVCGIPTAGSWSLDALAPAKACLLQQTRQRTSELLA